jgi:hypothetical protein
VRRIDWDSAIRSLVLVHIGQQLGFEGPTAKIVFEIAEIVLTILS